MSDLAPVVLAQAETANIICAAWHTALIGEAGQICSTNKKFSRILFHLLRFTYWQSMNRRTNSISAA
jgi:hypothetical protein